VSLALPRFHHKTLSNDPPQSGMRPTLSQRVLALFFVAAGVLHFAFPAPYLRIMPPWLPWHVQLVAISGVCEIAGGLGVLLAMTRRFAGIGLIALCLAVLPANVQMLVNAHADGAAGWWQAVLVLRLPLQGLLMFWIWKATRLY
jgi:uncharacterized membrane protein